jgi:hypothetical protein
MKDLDGLIADHDAHADALLARYEHEQMMAELGADRSDEIATRAKTTWDAMRSTRHRHLDDDLDSDYEGPFYDHEIETDPDYWRSGEARR